MDFYSMLLARKLKKESGGDVTIESLVVRENGNYSETGKAYSPVVVNIPFPENGYLLESASGQAINISDGAPLYLQECKAEIESVQEGSGDPSPTNIRPISGQTEVNVTRNGKTYTIQLGETIYGGELDVVTGELTATHESVDLGALSWTFSDGFFRTNELIATVKKPINNQTMVNAISSIYPIMTWADISATDTAIAVSVAGQMIVGNPNITSVEDFVTAVQGQTLVYELAEPQTIQLTPKQIRLLEGVNNLSCNTGELNIEYFGKGGN